MFEFARKTYSRDEEPSGADSYSKRLGLGGAVTLTISQVALAFAIGGLAVHRLFDCAWIGLAVGAMVALCCFVCARPWRAEPAPFRMAMQLFIVLFYVGVSFWVLMARVAA